MVWVGSSPPRILMQTLLRGSAAPGWVRATLARTCHGSLRLLCLLQAWIQSSRAAGSPLPACGPKVVETCRPRAPVEPRLTDKIFASHGLPRASRDVADSLAKALLGNFFELGIRN